MSFWQDFWKHLKMCRFRRIWGAKICYFHRIFKTQKIEDLFFLRSRFIFLKTKFFSRSKKIQDLFFFILGKHFNFFNHIFLCHFCRIWKTKMCYFDRIFPKKFRICHFDRIFKKNQNVSFSQDFRVELKIKKQK